MTDLDAGLYKILQVGREVSMRGTGISLRDALVQSHYKELRASFTATDLIPLIESHPEIVSDWVMYSEDKRTSGGWYLLDTGEIGQVSTPARRKFPTMPAAVADYVVRELDFWAGVAV